MNGRTVCYNGLQQYNLMAQYLHIRVARVEILHNNGIEESYFSVTHRDKQYFSSVFTRESADLGDDMLVELEEGGLPEGLTLQRWENCMMVFSWELEVGELRNRSLLKKRVETRQEEVVHLEMWVYGERDIFLTDRHVESISQHYLILEDLHSCAQQPTRNHNALTYYTLQTARASYFLPLRGAVVLLKLPDWLEISSFLNNHFNGKSARVGLDRLQNNQEIDIVKEGKSTGRVRVRAKWGVNLHRFRSDQGLLAESNEVLLYDFEIKFESTVEAAGCRLRIQQGSKVFEFSEDIDHSKTTKIKKVVFFIIKSESEEVELTLHKNGKPFSTSRFSSNDLPYNLLTLLKKKWLDPNNPAKAYGFIKMRAERGRNVSVPQWNRGWRQALRRKQTPTNMMVSISQLSAYFSQNQPLKLVAKVDSEERVLKTLPNLNFFNEHEQQAAEMLEFSIKGEESIYFIVKTDLKSSDFCGIGVVNTGELRLGLNACEVGYFKNQEKAGTLNCIINKIVFWPFMKASLQPEPPQQPLPFEQVDLFLTKIALTPYFYTYKYDNKREVYCIVEVNRLKKVLILENTEHDPLSFTAAPSSDQLTYSLQHPDPIAVKLTFIVSDLGHEEEIYGTSVCRLRAQDLNLKEAKFKNLQIKNDYSANLGLVSLEVFRAASPKTLPKPVQRQEYEKKSIGSFELSQASFETNGASNSKGSPSRRYSGSYIKSSKPMIHDFLKKNTHPNKGNEIKLPVIKERKDKNNFEDLVQLMKVRKRGHGGFYEENGSSVQGKLEERERRKQRQSYDLKRIEQSNPNLDRNLQILFPKKPNDRPSQPPRSKQQDYEERLKGLRSVMNEMQDIGEVEPSVAEERHQEPSEANERTNEYEERLPQDLEGENEAEWEGNEFV